MALDPLTLAVLRGALEEVSDEMDQVLVRSAFSPVICEALDRASGIYDPQDGGVIVQGRTGLPIFIGTMQYAVHAVIERYRRDGFEEGDVLIVNDPYVGGTHLMDVKVISPFFHEGRLVCFLANTGHWVDVGGSTPSGFGASATDLIQEGLRIPILKIGTKAGLNAEVVDLIFANLRAPEETKGDFLAQLNAVRHGAGRMRHLVERFGLDTVLAGFGELRQRAREHMQAEIASIPDGDYAFTDYLDGDGRDREDIRLQLRVTKQGQRLVLDFDGTDPQVMAPLNLPRECTASAAFVAIKHLFPEVPINAGALEALEFRIPQGSILAAAYPRATGAYNETGQRVIDVVFGCLAQALPDRAYAAPFGTAANVTIGGSDQRGRGFTIYLFHGGGYGASKLGDGLTNGTVPLGIARTQPVEVVEQRYPLKFRRIEIRDDSCGHGTFRGGLGLTYEVEVLAAQASVSVLADRAKHRPFGLLGGTAAAPTRIEVRRGGQPVALPQSSKGQVAGLGKGDTVCIQTPGGGGYGPPAGRDRDSVRRDVRMGYISARTASTVYGVNDQPTPRKGGKDEKV